MAAKLECEICGGKLIGKPGGIFECESCGMEYDCGEGLLAFFGMYVFD